MEPPDLDPDMPPFADRQWARKPRLRAGRVLAHGHHLKASQRCAGAGVPPGLNSPLRPRATTNKGTRYRANGKGQMAEKLGLSGAVSEEHFARLSEGKTPQERGSDGEASGSPGVQKRGRFDHQRRWNIGPVGMRPFPLPNRCR